MSGADPIALAQEALMLGVAVSLPVVAAACVVSFVVSVLQAATQISDSTLSHLPRFLIVALVLGTLGSWMGSQVLAFAARAFATAT